MKKIKSTLLVFMVFTVTLFSACTKTDNVQDLLSHICLDLNLECSEVMSDNIDRYSTEGIINYGSYSTTIIGGFDLHSQVVSYFDSKSWYPDLNNMADGMGGSLVGYTKDNISCQILGSWELDQDLEFTGSGNTTIKCFDQTQDK